jgi:hypothetical protein
MTTFHWFLSFRDADANRNLGGCMVVVEDDDPPNMELAVEAAWHLDCNPGGEVLGFTAEGSDPSIAEAVKHMPVGKLFTEPEVADLWRPYNIQTRKPKVEDLPDSPGWIAT